MKWNKNSVHAMAQKTCFDFSTQFDFLSFSFVKPSTKKKEKNENLIEMWSKQIDLLKFKCDGMKNPLILRPSTPLAHLYCFLFI